MPFDITVETVPAEGDRYAVWYEHEKCISTYRLL